MFTNILLIYVLTLSAHGRMPSDESLKIFRESLEREYKHVNHTKVYTMEDMKERQAAYDRSKRTKFWNHIFGVDTHKKQLIEICSTGIDRLLAGPTSREQM